MPPYQHPDAAESIDPARAEAAQLLREVAFEVVRTAEGILGAATRGSSALASPRLARSVVRHPGTGLPAQWALLRALTRRDGLGFAAKAPDGLLKRFGQVGEMCGQENLASLVAVTSLRMRVAAVLLEHPELAQDTGMRRLMDAVTAERDLEAVRALRALLKDRGAQRTMAALAPVVAELSAIRALLDDNPLNDDAGWQIATGREMNADPWAGIAARHLAAFDEGEGAATPVDVEESDGRAIALEASLMGCLGNIALLGTDGRILIQDVLGPDGTVRHVLQVPGMAPGKPRNDTPQDFIGAWDNLFEPDSPYTRGILLAIDEYGLPDGAELAMIGHSEGGIAIMNLAQNRGFSERFRVTHVVAVGSPIDNKKPADPDTWVATVTNQHDLIPTLDGRGAGSGAVFNPHPDWYEVDYVDPTHDFPLCHSLPKYIENLEQDLPDARRDIDEALTPYRGTVLRSQAYELKDRAHPPQGYPLMAVPTTPVATSAGPAETPVRYYDSTTAIAFFAIRPDRARELLPDISWMEPTRFGPRVLVALSAYQHRCVSLGPYSELSLAVLVNDFWRPRSRDVLRDLLRRADTRRTGRQVTALAVTTPEAQALSREVWGQNAHLAAVETELTGRRLRAVLRDRDAAPDGAPLVELSGELGPSVLSPRMDSVLYGRPADTTIRTLVHTAGSLHVHLAPRARLRLGDGDGSTALPLVQQLRALGLHGARPLIVLSAAEYQGRRSAGAELPR